MSLPTTAGYPQYANSNIAFIPTLYSKLMVPKYYDASVVTAITNTNYEGEISDMGDKVIIRSRPSITINDYAKGKTLTYEVPSAPPVELNIDKGKDYGFVIDVVDDKQADVVLADTFLDDSAEQMKIAIDSDVLANVYADAASTNQGANAGRKSGAFNLGTNASPLGVNSANVIQFLTSISTVFDEQNVPESDRCVVMPLWMRYLIMNSELRQAYITGDAQSIIRNGRLGEVDRLMLYKSNLLKTEVLGGENCTHIIACHKDAITFAAQLVRNESLPAPNQFGRLYRGLQVYGYKVVKPEALIHAIAYRAAEPS
jgi:hypothetical protein